MQAEWFASWFDSPTISGFMPIGATPRRRGFIDTLIGRLRPLTAHACSIRDAARDATPGSWRRKATTYRDRSVRQQHRRCEEGERPHLRFRLQDMRVPFGSRTFDCIFNFFTSFGYFEDAADHEAVMRNMAAALKDDGRLVIDYLNVRHADGI